MREETAVFLGLLFGIVVVGWRGLHERVDQIMARGDRDA